MKISTNKSNHTTKYKEIHLGIISFPDEISEIEDKSLLNHFKKLGLSYRKVNSVNYIHNSANENCYIVWNTYYTFEQFKSIMLKFCELYRQKKVIVGRKKRNAKEGYKTEILNISDKNSTSYKSKYLCGETLEPTVNFKSAVASNTFIGAYARRDALKEFLLIKL